MKRKLTGVGSRAATIELFERICDPCVQHAAAARAKRLIEDLLQQRVGETKYRWLRHSVFNEYAPPTELIDSGGKFGVAGFGEPGHLIE